MTVYLFPFYNNSEKKTDDFKKKMQEESEKRNTEIGSLWANKSRYQYYLMSLYIRLVMVLRNKDFYFTVSCHLYIFDSLMSTGRAFFTKINIKILNKRFSF